MSDRPPIALPIKREVRQRCGFGCVICGLPFYDYDHLLGWANVQRHVADEITLLCKLHHDEKTSELLPNEVVVEANKNPYNLREGVSKPYTLHFSGTACEIILGGNSFTTNDNGFGTQTLPLIVDGVPLLGFTMADGHLLLNLFLIDESNHVVMKIEENELVFSSKLWDIEFVGRRLIVRRAMRDIFIDIVFEVPNRIIINRGHFRFNGIKIDIIPEAVITNDYLRYSGNRAFNVPAGIILGENPQNYFGIIRENPPPRVN